MKLNTSQVYFYNVTHHIVLLPLTPVRNIILRNISTIIISYAIGNTYPFAWKSSCCLMILTDTSFPLNSVRKENIVAIMFLKF